MRKTKPAETWVVYRTNGPQGQGPNAAPRPGQWDAIVRRAADKEDIRGVQGANAVCERSEWDAMAAAEPGRYTLVRDGILSEAEAERLARELPGGTGVPARLKTRR